MEKLFAGFFPSIKVFNKISQQGVRKQNRIVGVLAVKIESLHLDISNIEENNKRD